MPKCSLFLFDDTLYVGHYVYRRTGKTNYLLKLQQGEGILFDRYFSQFDFMKNTVINS